MNYRRRNISDQKRGHDKNQYKEIETLRDQLQQSRIAVEQISSVRKSQQSNLKDIDNIKHDLKQCAIQMNTEQKKNKVLTELIQILKGQMSKMKTKQKHVKEKEQLQTQKILKQMREDIDKIEQKKNQQVAHIAQLKQKAGSSRSQRVVYSSLFKKMEKQLKHHEQLYKEQLLNNQNLKIEFSKQNFDVRLKEKCDDYSEFVESSIHYDELNMKKSKDKSSYLTMAEDMDRKQFKKSFKFEKIGKDGSNSPTSYEKDEKKILQFEDFRLKVSLITGIENHEEIVDQFSNIEEENKAISKQITEMEEETDTRAQQIKRLRQKQKIQDLLENQVNLCKDEQTQRQSKTIAQLQQFNEICGMFGIKIEQKNQIDEGSIVLEECLSEIIGQSQYKPSNLCLMRASSHQLSQVLLKMQKFGLCDKLLDRQGFCGQYKKEVMKKNKTPVKIKK